MLSRVKLERVLRVATLEESEKYDREDWARTTAEERIATVERLRREWFADFAPERRLARVLACTDLDGNPIPFDRGNKAASGRTKDLLDVELLKKRRRARRR
jgi:hypothetical protein